MYYFKVSKTSLKNFAVHYTPIVQSACFFGMAAIPFLCKGLLLNQLDLPRVNLVFTLKSVKVYYHYARFLIPYLSIFFGNKRTNTS